MTESQIRPAGPDRRLPDPAIEPTLSVERAAAVLGLSRGYVYELIRLNDPSIPVLRIGTRVLIPTARLLAMLHGQEVA